MGLELLPNPFWDPRLHRVGLLSEAEAVGGSEGRLLLHPGPRSPAFPGLSIPFSCRAPQIRYKEEFEKNKGKGFSVVADTPELQRIKKTQDQISNVSGSLSPPLL